MEKHLNSLEDISISAQKEKESFYNNLKRQIENNPQLQIRQINSGGKKMIVRLSVEEAVNQHPDWKDSLYSFEERCSQEFSKCLENLKKELGI